MYWYMKAKEFLESEGYEYVGDDGGLVFFKGRNGRVYGADEENIAKAIRYKEEKSMDEHGKLYMEQMQEWLKEQEVLEEQLERAVDYHEELSKNHREVAKSNWRQLTLHRERVKLAEEEYENWLKENGIEKVEGEKFE